MIRPAPVPRLLRSTSAALAAALALIVATAAVAVEVKVSAKPVDFSVYETWDWKALPEGQKIPGGEEVERAIREQTEKSLKRRGLERVTGEPDLLVSYTGYVQDVLTIEGVEREVAPGISWVGHPDAHAMWGYEVGTLVIEIYDAASGEIVWSGWGSDVGRDLRALRRKARPVTRKILESFPPSP